MDEHDMMMEEMMFPTVEDEPQPEDTDGHCPECDKPTQFGELCYRCSQGDDGQPSELQENQDFAQDDDWHNMYPHEYGTCSNEY